MHQRLSSSFRRTFNFFNQLFVSACIAKEHCNRQLEPGPAPAAETPSQIGPERPFAGTIQNSVDHTRLNQTVLQGPGSLPPGHLRRRPERPVTAVPAIVTSHGPARSSRQRPAPGGLRGPPGALLRLRGAGRRNGGRASELPQCSPCRRGPGSPP